MNKKGESQVGVLLGLAILLIVGVVLFQASAQEIGGAVNTVALANQSLTGAAVDATAQFLPFRALSGVLVFNATGDNEVVATNYTVANNVINPTTGALSVSITPNSPAPELGFGEGTWTVDATAQPTTYIAESGGRAIANIILLLFAVALAVLAIAPTVRQKLFDM